MKTLMIASTMLLCAILPASAQKATGKGGVSCTYAQCMKNCTTFGGRASGCPGYCENILKQRHADGSCKG